MSKKNSIAVLLVMAVIVALAALAVVLVAYSGPSSFHALITDKQLVDVSDEDLPLHEESNQLVSFNSKTEDDSLNFDETVMNVDWEKLEQTYPNIIGWIYCPHTAINAPLLACESKRDIVYDDMSFSVAEQPDAELKSENTVIYAPHMDFSAYKDEKFLADENSGLYRDEIVIRLKTGEQYIASIWGLANPEKFGKRSIEERTFKNLFDKEAWIEQASQACTNKELEYAPEDIEPLLTIIGGGKPAYSILAVVYPSEAV